MATPSQHTLVQHQRQIHMPVLIHMLQATIFINQHLQLLLHLVYGTTSGVPPPPPKASYKHETEGWNDLPDTFKAKTAAPRRAAAAATPPVSTPTPVSAPAFGSPGQPPSAPSQPGSVGSVSSAGYPKKTFSATNVLPPPPKVSVVLPREQRFQLLQPFQLHQNPLLSRISMHLQLPRMLCNLHHQDLHLQR